MKSADQIFDECTTNRDVPVGASKERNDENGTPKTARPEEFSVRPLRPGVYDGPDALHNQKEAWVTVAHEKPEHRIIILLKAQGHKDHEIADLTGYTRVHVGNVLKQPWAVERVMQEINAAGRNPVVQMFKGTAVKAAQLLESVIDNPKAKHSDQISAAKEVLDRAFGKASQPLEHTFSEEQLSKMSDEELAKIAVGIGVTQTGTA